MPDQFNVLLLGAGPINFGEPHFGCANQKSMLITGTTEGPWNHVSHPYQLLDVN